MTADRDLHDIHSALHRGTVARAPASDSCNYVAHRMRLLYVAVTKGWLAALFYDQQGADEFLGLPDKIPTT